MLSKYMVACLVATALTAAPALAQTANAPAANAPAATGARSQPAAQNVSAADFVKEAANSDMFEIQSSQVAADKIKDGKIHDFAQRMIRDHTQSSEKLKAAAKGQTVPTSLDAEHAQKLQQLKQASGDDFARSYVQMQVEGHQKAVSLFDSYAQHGDNAELKQFAQQTLPTLREHLQMITQIQSASTGSGQPGQSMAQGYMTQEMPNVWRGSKLINLDVYNQNNEKVGDINEVLVDRDGKVEAVVIGVGGFLGIGEHNVAVPFNALQWSMTAPGAKTNAASNPAGARTGAPGTMAVAPAPSSPVTGTTGTNTAATNTGPGVAPAAGTAAPMNAAARSAERGYPDHAVLPNASKDQLKNAPQFHYGSGR